MIWGFFDTILVGESTAAFDMRRKNFSRVKRREKIDEGRGNEDPRKRI